MKVVETRTSMYGESLEERRHHAKPARTEKRALVKLRADGLRCDLYVRSFHHSEESATYELVVFNDSWVAIVCRIYGLDATANTREFGMLAVPAGSAGSTFLTVPLETSGRRRIFVEAIGEGVNVFAEAVQPAAMAQWRSPSRAVTIPALAFLLGCGFLFCRPSVQAFTVAPVATSNTVRAVYAVGGIQSASYSASLPDGSVFAHGDLTQNSGVITIPLPDAATGKRVRIALDVRGPLGREGRTAMVAVMPDPMSTAQAIVNKGSGLPAFTGIETSLPAGTAPAFHVPERVIAGRTFTVSFAQPQPDLQLTLKDNLQAVVAERFVTGGTQRVTFATPASPAIQTYYLTRSFAQPGGRKDVVQSLRVYPQ